MSCTVCTRSIHSLDAERTDHTSVAIPATMSLMAPLKRVYFDTNILFRWPHLPNDVRAIFGLAKWVGTELYLPNVVESELEAQYVRSVDAVYDSLESNCRKLDGLCRNVVPLDLKGSRPSTEEISKAFRVHSDQLKRALGLSNIPLTTEGLDVFIDMAINRRAPFEEYEVASKKTQVVGLQDAAVLFSIIDHMKTARGDDRCGLVSTDGVFQKAETRKVMERRGVKLEVFKNARAVFDELWSHVWGATRTAWDAEIQQIETSLNLQKEHLAEKVLSLISKSGLEQRIWKRAREIKRFRLTGFSLVRTELPESEHRPPNSASYARPEGSAVSISARAATEIDAVVEAFDWYSFILLGVKPLGSGEALPEPRIEDAQLSEALNVSLTGTVHNGVIADFEVSGVDLIQA